MSINGALQIGRSALAVSQAALQVAGNNMSNAATVGFHRQSIHLAPLRGEVLGRNTQVGGGVQLLAIRREVDAALQARLRQSISQQSRDLIDKRFLNTIESLQNELSGSDISSELGAFFNSFSELANQPHDNGIRQLVIQKGASLAARLVSLRQNYSATLAEIDRGLTAHVGQVNDLLNRIAQVNAQIRDSESGGAGPANALRDHRDLLVNELSQYVEVTTIEHGNGGMDILVGSTPILLAGQVRGLEVRTTASEGQTEITLRVAADGTLIPVSQANGAIGGLLRQRELTVRPAMDDLNALARQLIHHVNRLHSQGQGKTGFTNVSGTYRAQNAAAALNSAAPSGAGLPFKIENGSVFIHMTHAESGTRTTHQVQINGDAMSLNDLVAQINGMVPQITAGVSDGRLTLNAAAGYQISFSDDTSGALAALGINTFFAGSSASDIAVNALLQSNPDLLAAGDGHVDGSNGTALAIANLLSQRLDAIGGRTLQEHWQQSVNGLAVRANAANLAVESSSLVRQNLESQAQAVSGVSLDEESMNLLTFQRQFQAAARFISVIDEAMRTLLAIA